MNESVFAKTVMDQKYAHDTEEGKETWEQIAHRVPTSVLKAVSAPKSLVREVEALIAAKKFIPGGRYLAASGRPFHQTQNCLLMSAEDSREGWANIMHQSTMGLMSGAGIGIWYGDLRSEGRPIRKTGGVSSGPLALMQMVNEAGRWIRQGGDRRAAIWAGLHWDHADILKFIAMKNWSEEVRAMKAKDYNFPAPMDGTNISVGLDDKFFKAYADEKHEHHSLAQGVYWTTVRQMLKTAEPGFSVNTGANRGECLRNAPVCAETMVLTKDGYVPAVQLVGIRSTVWTGKQWAEDVLFTQTGDAAPIVVVTMTGGREIRCDSSHPFLVERYIGAGARRELVGIDRRAAASLLPGDIIHVSMPPTPKNEKLHQDAYLLGYVYGDDRSKDVFPEELYKSSPQEAGSFIAGLMDADGNWEPQQKRLRLSSKYEGFLRGVARLLEQHGILAGVTRAGHSTFRQAQTYQLVVMAEFNQKFNDFVPSVRVRPSLDGYQPYRSSLVRVLSVEEAGTAPVFCADVHKPEHSFQAEGVIVSNCTEITSRDDSDICNLGSINMANITSLEEMDKCVDLGIAFLLAGTVYSDVPYGKVDGVRTKNRRLGLGLMGIHEWLLKHGKPYGPDEELAKYMEIYAKSTEVAAKWAKEWELTAPIKTRAIAPTGTIGIIAETTTGMEPIFCVAYKRRYLKGNVINYQYVIDPAAQRLIESGIAPEAIEDAYVLAENVERRVAFQAWLQQYVDHSISSTINLPAWGSELNNESRVREFGDMLMKYLPQLRGITCYPDGARGGQPLTPVAYKTAIKHVGEVFSEVVLEQADVCDITKGGSCGA